MSTEDGFFSTLSLLLSVDSRTSSFHQSFPFYKDLWPKEKQKGDTEIEIRDRVTQTGKHFKAPKGFQMKIYKMLTVSLRF